MPTVVPHDDAGQDACGCPVAFAGGDLDPLTVNGDPGQLRSEAEEDVGVGGEAFGQDPVHLMGFDGEGEGVGALSPVVAGAHEEPAVAIKKVEGAIDRMGGGEDLVQEGELRQDPQSQGLDKLPPVHGSEVGALVQDQDPESQGGQVACQGEGANAGSGDDDIEGLGFLCRFRGHRRRLPDGGGDLEDRKGEGGARDAAPSPGRPGRGPTFSRSPVPWHQGEDKGGAPGNP